MIKIVIDTEPFRRVAASVLQWVAWATSAGVFIYATVKFDPDHGHFAPQWVPFAFIMSIGVGVSATLVRSRFRLTRAILGAFTQGREAAREETDQRVAVVVKRQDEIVTKLEAYVQAQEVRADVAQRQQEILDKLTAIEKKEEDAM